MARSPSLVLSPRSRPRTTPFRPSPLSRAREIKSADPVQARAEQRLRSFSLHEVLGRDQTELLRLAVRRSRLALACPCGGLARKVKCTHGELARFGGERFARAFVCSACRTRYVGRARAPLA
jgi:hypothetical protein